MSGGEPWKRERVLRIANEAASVTTRVNADDLFTDQGYIGEGYGIPTAECLEAIRLLAETEGILLDPVYTGKATACLIDHFRRDELHPSETVLFLHTGGVPALFPHAAAFQTPAALPSSGGHGALLLPDRNALTVPASGSNRCLYTQAVSLASR